jgi:hypothetical protein
MKFILVSHLLEKLYEFLYYSSSSLIAICQLCHLNWHSRGDDGRCVRRQIWKTLEYHFLRLLSYWWSCYPLSVTWLYHAFSGTSSFGLRSWLVDDAGANLSGRVCPCGHPLAACLVLLLYVLLGPYSLLSLGCDFPRTATLYVCSGRVSKCHSDIINAFHSVRAASLPRSLWQHDKCR